jgi:DNA-binding transcriptional ArsR family regulator
MTQEVCEIYCHDEQKVSRVSAALQNVDTPEIARMFKALSDETRMKIIYALCREDELCVCDVAHIIGSTVATASHHLRLLKQMGLAKYRKEGKMVFYSIDDDHVRQLIDIALAHMKERFPHE